MPNQFYSLFLRALKYLIPVTSQTAIQKSGLSPVHSAADGQNSQCVELLIENGFDVNTLLAEHISHSYDDERKTALYFAVSNNDILCTEILLKAGANPNKDPLNCLLVAVRAGNHEIVRLLLSYGANVNCYFMLVNDTHFPSAIQYALNDEVMLRLLLNHGYNVEMCFDCMHQDIFGNSFVWSTPEEEILPGWTSSVIKDNPVNTYLPSFSSLCSFHQLGLNIPNYCAELRLTYGRNPSLKHPKNKTAIFHFLLWDRENYVHRLVLDQGSYIRDLGRKFQEIMRQDSGIPVRVLTNGVHVFPKRYRC